MDKYDFRTVEYREYAEARLTLTKAETVGAPGIEQQRVTVAVAEERAIVAAANFEAERKYHKPLPDEDNDLWRTYAVALTEETENYETRLLPDEPPVKFGM